jgi:aspartyl-tRNA(Asn)/glutamyl-tRNA(Gln) amidotransferase subunit C
MTEIDNDLIHKIAHLSRLHIEESDFPAYQDKLNNILEMLHIIDNTDVGDAKPMAHPMDLAQPLRDDEVVETDESKKLLKLAPKEKANLILVPVVID